MFFLIETGPPQQTLECIVGRFDKRFSQRSPAILVLSHDTLTERQGLASCFVCFAVGARVVLGLGGNSFRVMSSGKEEILLRFMYAFDERRTGVWVRGIKKKVCCRPGQVANRRCWRAGLTSCRLRRGHRVR